MSQSNNDPKLHKELQALLDDIRLNRNFNAKLWIEDKCRLFNEYMTSNGLSGCVINLSGGIDSAVTLGLVKYASKMSNSNIKKIVALSQPIESSNWAFNRALEAANEFNVKLVTIDQTSIFHNLKNEITNNINKTYSNEKSLSENRFAAGQLKSYMRTPVVYYVAQLLSANGCPSIVMGTGNQDEDGYLAYFCKAGDGVVDVQLISDLHKSQVFEVGKILNVPNSILIAKPSADLWEDQTDEDELGFPYDFIELWTNFLNFNKNKQNKIKSNLSKDALEQFNTWSNKAISIHKRNKHKLNSPYNIISKL